LFWQIDIHLVSRAVAEFDHREQIPSDATGREVVISALHDWAACSFSCRASERAALSVDLIGQASDCLGDVAHDFPRGVDLPSVSNESSAIFGFAAVMRD
jgi:hypothetical protein